MKSLIVIWKARNEIAEGIKNNLFKKADIEQIAAVRSDICNFCEYIDHKGTKCLVPGTAPCCGSCGCSLALKLRSLSTSCPEGFWKAEVSPEEEDAIRASIE